MDSTRQCTHDHEYSIESTDEIGFGILYPGIGNNNIVSYETPECGRRDFIALFRDFSGAVSFALTFHALNSYSIHPYLIKSKCIPKRIDGEWKT
ncbi:hypothetical protein COU54_01395 [Candidatus Pacearchaeota archaeon CG10_big_fil_rev_8_21_14_0_10_31_24]|nr:MAG: hypothetical protein COU54_01395 [Candidatus Pacearchaeota archaeon CG10_big_fil_rev_8_21_14_0_10_31_24]